MYVIGVCLQSMYVIGVCLQSMYVIGVCLQSMYACGYKVCTLTYMRFVITRMPCPCTRIHKAIIIAPEFTTRKLVPHVCSLRETCNASVFTTRKRVPHVCSLVKNLSRTCVHYASIFVFHVCSLLLHIRLLTCSQSVNICLLYMCSKICKECLKII